MMTNDDDLGSVVFIFFLPALLDECSGAFSFICYYLTGGVKKGGNKKRTTETKVSCFSFSFFFFLDFHNFLNVLYIFQYL